MSIATEITRLQTAKSDLKTSIENKGVTVPSATTLDGYAALVDQISSGGGGGGGSATDPVRFIDYDGTILYSYSAEDFANLTEMPANPSHTGLTAQGWNWTLTDAKTYVATYGMLDIGQMYVTDDGKTRVYISLVDSARLSPYLGICPNGTVVVDWGDNTATDTLTGTSLTTVKRAQHTYASTGDYVISLTVSSGSFAIYGSSSSTNGSYLLTRTNGDIISQTCYQNAIKKVELGTNVSLGANAFNNCYSLTSITIPSGVTSIGNNAFNNCYSLASITIPNSVTSIDNAFNNCYSLTSIMIPSGVKSIGTLKNCYSLASITIPSGFTSIGLFMFDTCYSLASITIPNSVKSIGVNAFNNCYSLTSITIPSGVKSIGSSAFNNCYHLTSITIPSNVTSIGSMAFGNCYPLTSITIPSGVKSIDGSVFYNCRSLSNITIPSGVTSIGSSAFYNCYAIAEYHFLPTTPPTLSNTNAFSGIPDDCIIYVPSASLSAYQTATNWSTYASKMVGE